MSTVTQKRKSLALSWQLCAVLVLAAAVLVAPDLANANNDTPIGDIFCVVVGWFTGNTGRGLATIAVTIIGIGALLGKVSWGMALIVGLGIALVFGAAGIITAINSGTGSATNISTECSTNATFNNAR